MSPLDLARDLLAEVRAHTGTVTVHVDGELRVRAPEALLTPAFVAKLRQYKAELRPLSARAIRNALERR